MGKTNHTEGKILIYDGNDYISVYSNEIERCDKDEDYVNVKLKGVEKSLVCVDTIKNCVEMLQHEGFQCTDSGNLLNLQKMKNLNRETRKMTLIDGSTSIITPNRYNATVAALAQIHSGIIGRLPGRICNMIEKWNTGKNFEMNYCGFNQGVNFCCMP